MQKPQNHKLKIWNDGGREWFYAPSAHIRLRRRKGGSAIEYSNGQKRIYGEEYKRNPHFRSYRIFYSG